MGPTTSPQKQIHKQQEYPYISRWEWLWGSNMQPVEFQQDWLP